MLPEFDVRLRSLSKAIEQVILPALPVGEKLAREQAGLILGHLHVMLMQWKYQLDFARMSARNLLALKEEIKPLAMSDDDIALEDASGALSNIDAMGFDELLLASNRLGSVIEEICSRARLGRRAEAAFRTAIFAHTRRQAEIESTWFSGMRPDVDNDLPLRNLVTKQAESG